MALIASFQDKLADLGWRLGSNLEFEVRWSAASADSTRKAAQELMEWKPDVVLARNTISVEKLLELRAELPIVFVSVLTRSARALSPRWRGQGRTSPAS